VIVIGNTSGVDQAEGEGKQWRLADETIDRLPEVTCMKSDNESKFAYENGFDRASFKKSLSEMALMNSRGWSFPIETAWREHCLYSIVFGKCVSASGLNCILCFLLKSFISWSSGWAIHRPLASMAQILSPVTRCRRLSCVCACSLGSNCRHIIKRTCFSWQVSG
jgi:hypothetical protein